jgi:hypothetical protein
MDSNPPWRSFPVAATALALSALLPLAGSACLGVVGTLEPPPPPGPSPTTAGVAPTETTLINTCRPTGLPGTPVDPAMPASESFDIAEAVFRYQFEHNASGQKTSAPAYYLVLLGADPPPEFLARFGDLSKPVMAGSEADPDYPNGLEFRVDSMERISASSVVVEGGYYEGPLSASGNTYLVEVVYGRWVVTCEVMDWIS